MLLFRVTFPKPWLLSSIPCRLGSPIEIVASSRNMPRTDGTSTTPQAAVAHIHVQQFAHQATTPKQESSPTSSPALGSEPTKLLIWSCHERKSISDVSQTDVYWVLKSMVVDLRTVR